MSRDPVELGVDRLSQEIEFFFWIFSMMGMVFKDDDIALRTDCESEKTEKSGE